MSDDSSDVGSKTEDQVQDNEEENASKCKKIKISNDESEQGDSNENVDTKSEMSEASKDASENLVISNGDSSTNKSDSVVTNVDSSSNNSDNWSNEREQVDSVTGTLDETSKDKAEAEQSDSLIKDDSQATKSESSKCTDLVTDNEKATVTQVDSDDKIDESKDSLKNNKETLYELLNNPMDVKDDTSNTGSNGKTEVSASSNGNTEQIDAVVVQDEGSSTEIQKNDEITCKELFDILQEKDKKIKKKVLIIDVRKEDEYSKSRMSFYDNLINIPSEKIQANKVPGYYRYILMYNIEAEKKFTRRSQNDIIVLVDKNSELKTMDSDSTIAIFKHCLEEYDVHIDYKRIAVLKGGFEEWTNSYPDLVTKS